MILGTKCNIGAPLAFARAFKYTLIGHFDSILHFESVTCNLLQSPSSYVICSVLHIEKEETGNCSKCMKGVCMKYNKYYH